MQRGKRRTVSQVGHDRTDYDWRSTAFRRLDYRVQIVVEVVVNALKRLSVVAQQIVQKHFHATPIVRRRCV